MSITSTTLALQPLLGVEQLAELLHRSVHTIRLDAGRAPGRLPPLCRLPGHSRLLWRQEDVIKWINDHIQPPPTTPTPTPPRRRGRPTKVEQRARAAGKSL